MELNELESFRVVVSFEPKRTVLEVFEPDAVRPVARMEKVSNVRVRAAYQLWTGPTPNGTISTSGALDANGTPIGLVNLSGGTVADADLHPLSGDRHSYVQRDPTRWAVVQPGLPRLTGGAADNATALSFNRVVGFLHDQGVPVPTPGLLASAMTVSFSAADSPGFTVRTRMVARQGVFEVTVADQRVDRRLIMACLAAMTSQVLHTPRSEGLDMVAPFMRLFGRRR